MGATSPLFERRQPRPVTQGALGVLLLVLAGCGDSTSESADTDSTAVSAAPSTEEAGTVDEESGAAAQVAEDPADDESADAAEPPIVEVLARDYEFVGMPQSVPVGTRISLTSAAGGEPHEMVVLRMDELSQIASPDTKIVLWVQAYAGATDDPGFRPTEVGAPSPTVLTEPGHYWYVCTLPLGTTNEEFEKQRVFEDVDGSQTHIAAGMVGEFDVVDET